MPKVICKCNYIFHLNGSEQFSYTLINDNDLDEVLSLIDQECVDRDHLEAIIDRNAKPALLCPNCGRLLVEFERGAYRSYKIDP